MDLLPPPAARPALAFAAPPVPPIMPRSLSSSAGPHSCCSEDIADAFAAIPPYKWDRVAAALRSNGGVATVDFLPASVCSLHAAAFATARGALDAVAEVGGSGSSGGGRIRRIGPGDDSARATGYHAAGSDGSSLSRYNRHREGFVFSDGQMFDVPPSDPGIPSPFREDMLRLFQSMHDGIALEVLRAVARDLGLEDEAWFESALGPSGSSSQWHVKRFTEPEEAGSGSGSGADGDGDSAVPGSSGEGYEWLPVHTDPSLVSIVLHDVPGANEGGMGLQCQHQAAPGTRAGPREWREVPLHGHAVATVLVGSVLSYITGGLFPGARHRVVYRPALPRSRMAATLFLRPRGDAALSVPPSALLTGGGGGGGGGVRVRRTTFDAWIARVSKNYMRQKKKKNRKEEGGEGTDLRHESVLTGRCK